MTEKQQRALVRAYLILEHEFDRFILIAADKELSGDLNEPEPSTCWNGGKANTNYLASKAVDVIKYRKLGRCPPQIDPKIMNEEMKKFHANHK